MIRSVLSVLAGVVVAAIVVGVVEVICHSIFPPPPGIDVTSPEALRAIIATLPVGAIAAVLVAWGLGSLAGGFTAAILTRRARFLHAAIVGCIQMAFGIVTMFMIPHPLWFVVASFVIVLPSALLGAHLAHLVRPTPLTGPRPYDMRRKNMAC